MKQRIFSFALVLALCVGLTVPASAATTAYENAPDFGASTWVSQEMYPISGITVVKDKTNFERETGLTVFEEREVFHIGGAGGFATSKTYYGLKDNSGNVVFPASFTSFEYIGENRIIAEKSDKNQTDSYGVWRNLGYGVYTTDGRVLYAPSAAAIAYANNEKRTFLITNSQNLTGLYDWNFKELVPQKYLMISYMADGYYRLQEGQMGPNSTFSYGIYKYGVGIVIPCQKDIGISYIGPDMFRIRLAPFSYIAVDGNGKQVLSSTYAGISSYRDGYFAVAIARSENDHQNAIAKNAPSASYNSECGAVYAGDISDIDSYLTMGIVDRNERLYSSFSHDIVYIDELGQVHFQTWNGEHEWVWPHGKTGMFADWKHWAKSYSKETVSVSALTATGKTISDLLNERGLSLVGTNTTNPSISTVGGFNDVKSTDYFADSVLWAVEKKITSGTSATTFSPNATCSKAQILTFLWRANGSPEPTTANPFTDIKTTDYYYKAALWAAEKGLVSGTTFGANTDCTRAMTVEYLWKAAGRPTAAQQASFTDVSANADYAQAVAWAVEKGITSGTSKTTFSPAATCTRGQIVTFLYRAMQ